MVALAYDVVREEERALVKAAASLGVGLRLVEIGDVLALDAWEPDVYLVRTLSHNKGIIFASAVESRGGVAVNSSAALATSWNKALTLTKLLAAGLPVPKSFVLFGKAPLDVEGRKIVKAVSGSWGRKVSLVTSREELEVLLKSAEGEVLLLQEAVGTGEDIRVFVIGDRAVAAMRRIPPSGDWRSNAARGGTTLPQPIDGELEELAVKAAKAVGAYYAGVDILVGDRYYVNEVNGIPEFKALMRTTGVDVAKELVLAVHELAKR